MGRTPDSNTEKLASLYKQREALKKRITALSELNETEMRVMALKDANAKLAEVQAEIDMMDDL